MDIFEALSRDHDIQRDVLQKLLETSGDTEDREQFYDELKRELTAHAIAEERHFYMALMESDETQEKARHSIAEHHDLDELVEQLDETDRSSSAWLATAKKLGECLRHHLDEEEQEVFAAAKAVLSERQRASLGQAYRDEMDTQKMADA